MMIKSFTKMVIYRRIMHHFLNRIHGSEFFSKPGKLIMLRIAKSMNFYDFGSTFKFIKKIVFYEITQEAAPGLRIRILYIVAYEESEYAIY